MHIGLGERDSKGNPPFYAITYSDVIPGPKLDLEKLKGVVVTVTGKIEEYGQTGFASVKTIALNNDSLVVHLLDGTTKKFPPFGENHFIPDWSFSDDDKAVIRSLWGVSWSCVIRTV